MWRKLLIVCVCAAIPWTSFGAATIPHENSEPVARAVSYQGNPVVTPELKPDARRIALVIGNGRYRDDPLRNPVNDARAMSRALGMLGFTVLLYENVDHHRMHDAVLEFNRQLGAGGIGVFYYSGHGLQVADKTLLTPIDVERQFPATQLTRGLDLRIVLDSMSKPRPGKVNVLMLDTCLSNPFRIDGGKSINAPEQTIIGYATAPGSFAADEAGHGLYTAELLKAMAVPGRDIREIFQRAGEAVRRASARRQIPWVASSLSGELRFAAAMPETLMPPSPTSTHSAAIQPEAIFTVQRRGILPKDSTEQYELTFWESIKDSTHASDYDAYLQAYPNGRFAALARARSARLRAAPAKTEAPKEVIRPAPAVKVPRAQDRPAPAAPERAPSVPATSRPAQTPSSVPAAVSEIKNCPNCPVLIALPPGSFTIGNNSSDPSERPAHEVSIKTGFAIGKYEVTVAQWNACVDAAACPRVMPDSDRANGNIPVRNVSWDDAQQYLKWLSTVSGKTYRLPTEAEWEYAARAGTSTRYWWGDQMRQGKANCKACGEPWNTNGPVNVGSFAANPYGLYDVNGSVWEWVGDCWHSSYKGAPADGRAWDAPNCRTRVIRGGSWRDGESYMLSSTRFKYDASVRESQNGFRVATDLK